MRAVEILATGPSALVQDLGRPGNAHLGVPPSGALDAPALRLANRLAGNPERAAGIEAVLGGLRLRALASCTAAVTGPAVAVTAGGRARDTHVPVHLAEGDVLELGTPATGLRCYVALSGGIRVEPELGSMATDVLSGIGPPALSEGDALRLGDPGGVPTGEDVLSPANPPSILDVEVLLGPREDWFGEPAAQLGRAWTVTPESNRVGVRLDGPPLRRAPGYADAELPSEGIVTGAVQVPPDGLPVVFLADHPTTGGYPVIGVVRAAALPSLAQARPGTSVRFRASSTVWSE